MDSIDYQFANSPFGPILLASTIKGICYLGFVEAAPSPLIDLQRCFPRVPLQEKTNPLHQQVFSLFTSASNPNLQSIPLDIHGTAFQHRVWRSLLSIPPGKYSSYARIAMDIGRPKAYRAVGTAVGQNPIALLIPCHRVRPSNGALGNYRWGSPRKQAMIDWENR